MNHAMAFSGEILPEELQVGWRSRQLRRGAFHPPGSLPAAPFFVQDRPAWSLPYGAHPL